MGFSFTDAPVFTTLSKKPVTIKPALISVLTGSSSGAATQANGSTLLTGTATPTTDPSSSVVTTATGTTGTTSTSSGTGSTTATTTTTTTPTTGTTTTDAATTTDTPIYKQWWFWAACVGVLGIAAYFYFTKIKK